MPGPHSPNPGVGTNGPAPYPEPSSHEPQALDYPTTSAPPNRPSPRDRQTTRRCRPPHIPACRRRCPTRSDGTSGC